MPRAVRGEHHNTRFDKGDVRMRGTGLIKEETFLIVHGESQEGIDR